MRLRFVVVMVLLLFRIASNGQEPGRLEDREAPDRRSLALAEIEEGVRSFKLRDYDLAIIYFHKAINANPNLFQGYYNLGTVYLEVGRYEEAVPALKQALLLKPDLPSTYRLLALSYYLMKEPALASECFEKQAQLEPTSAAARSDLGYTYLDLKRYEKSVESFREALRLDNKFAAADRGLCFTYSLMQENQEALKYCKFSATDRIQLLSNI